jgi:hypothetical protein
MGLSYPVSDGQEVRARPIAISVTGAGIALRSRMYGKKTNGPPRRRYVARQFSWFLDTMGCVSSHEMSGTKGLIRSSEMCMYRASLGLLGRLRKIFDGLEQRRSDLEADQGKGEGALGQVERR